MSAHDDIIRLRVHPGASPKSVPKARTDWPDGFIVYHSILRADGSLELGCALYCYDHRAFREVLVIPSEVAAGPVYDYCESHRPNVVPGVREDELWVLPLVRINPNGHSRGFGYELRQYGYRQGFAIVGTDLPRHLIGIADHWSEAEASPGEWSVALVGLGRWEENYGVPRYVKYPDAPRLRFKVFGDSVLISWGSTSKNDHRDRNGDVRRPFNRRGPFVDVLSPSSALAGGAVRDLGQALRIFGVDVGAEYTNPIDGLRAETLAIAELYRRQRSLIEELDLGLDHSNLISTGGIATALLRESEPGTS